MQNEKLGGRLRLILAAAIILGLFFRLYNIDHKAFWLDEASTSHLMSGYGNWEVREAMRQNPLSVAEFISYDGPRTERGFRDAVNVLLSEDAGNPMAYFAASYFWTRALQPLLGLVTAARTISAAFSIIQLPLMWWLACELFRSKRTAAYAVILLALSPFHVLYAQEARSYSLWGAAVLASSLMLVKAMKTSAKTHWALYGATVAVGLYTHNFFLLTIAAHVTYLAHIAGSKAAKPMAASLALAAIMYLPWLHAISGHADVLLTTTSWTSQRADLPGIIAWLGLGLSSTLIDYDLGSHELAKIPPILPPVAAATALILYAVWHLIGHGRRDARLFLALLMAWSLIPLLLSDLVAGGMRTCVPRYLTPLLIGAGMSVAHLLSEKTRGGSRLWSALCAAMVLSAVLSLALSSQSHIWWNKYMGRGFEAAVSEINGADRPLIVSDAENGVIWALSWSLKPDVLVVAAGGETPEISADGQTVFLYRPSDGLKDRMSARYTLHPVSGSLGLYKVAQRNLTNITVIPHI